MAALAIGGMVSWAYVWYRPSGRLSLPEIADGMSALVLSMVGATPKPDGAARNTDRVADPKSPRARGTRPKKARSPGRAAPHQ